MGPLLLIGFSGVGKTTLSKYLLEHYTRHFTNVVEVSDIVKQISKDKTGTDVLQNDTIKKELLKQITNTTIVTGLRETYLVEQIAQNYPTTYLAKLMLSEQKRIERLLHRGLNLEQIKTKYINEVKIGLFDLMYQNFNNVFDSKQSVITLAIDIMMHYTRRI